MTLFNRENYRFIGLSITAITLLINSTNTWADIPEGKKLFEATCAACHGKNLQGGTGFNLKDETWVHGSTTHEIQHNIKKGFSKAGMPSFDNVYSDNQIQSITNYILSKREGLSNLTYKIYHLPENSPKSFSVMKDLPIKKSGKLPTNLFDFLLPEVANYIIEFEADLYVPTDSPAKIFAMTWLELFEIEIDGNIIEPSLREWRRFAWPIKQGKQRIKLRYSTVGTKPNVDKRFKFFVANHALTQKLFGISEEGKQFLNKATFNIEANEKEVVVRKKIVNLPSATIAVGTPSKLNYAFNTKSCSVVGIWSGDFLNVGPNIEGRARDGSLIGGEWLFHFPKAIEHQLNKDSSCEFIKYNRSAGTVFYYINGANQYRLSIDIKNASTMVLNYTLISGNKHQITLDLPTNPLISYSSDVGKISDNQFNVDVQPGKTYSLTLSLSENI